MANHFEASPTAAALDLLLIGHVTRDLIDPADFTTYRLGGTVSFAAVTAARLGRKATIFTRAAPDMDYSALPPEVELHVLPSANTTTFANVYTPHGRVQYVYTPSEAITAADIPAAMRHPSAVLLGPLVGEVTPDVAALFGPGTLVAAVPQGWMRRWDEKGRVRSKEWDNASEILPHLDVLVLSLEDIDYDWHRLARAFDHVPMIVVTEYKEGSTVFQRQPDGSVVETKIPPRAAVERDPTGAGDTFTTAFLLHLQETGDPLQAARFGNITASISVEYPGVTGIPTREEVLSHMDEYPFAPNPQLSQYEANLA
jgi:sugar/nucleoside kinase (ribokinase family)